MRRGLDADEARQAALAFMNAGVPPASAGALLGVLGTRGETSAEIEGFARALRERAEPGPALPRDRVVVDTCGTGGDGRETLNVSTLAGLAVAGAGVGVGVAKHGNRAVSSRCGSADLLEALGVRTDVSRATAEISLRETGFCFLFAPTYHPALRHAAPIRRELGFRSVFNLAGPLANPAGVRRQVVGVPARRYVRPVAEALGRLGVERAFVVHARDGCDEISLDGTTDAVEVMGGAARPFEIDAQALGLPRATARALRVADEGDAVRAAQRVLAGEPGPALDVVALNAAAALLVAGRAASLSEGLDLSRAALLSGAAQRVLDSVRRISAEAA
jgi:anthranilate phosphoribosyltransferase